jgi:hypothetical protein
MELQTYTTNHIDAFLRSYDIFVTDLAAVAIDWDTMDAEIHSDYNADFLQIWSNRKVLGALFRSEKLTSVQETLLADLDRRLLAQAALLGRCFAVDLLQLVTIFRWGTPLIRSVQPLAIEIEPSSLERLAATPVFA